METVTIYGIRNCDTMKKAFNWLDGNKIAYQFHDYKKRGADPAVLKTAIDRLGWETVINRRGTSWRKLSAETQESMDKEKAIEAAMENPSLIKRPLLTRDNEIQIGFNIESYQELFKK